MDLFISQNPAVAIWAIGLLVSLLGFLVMALIFFLKRSFDGLAREIRLLAVAVAQEHEATGSLKDRMQKQETTCEMQRNICPNNGYPIPGMIPSMVQLVKSPE